MHCLAAAFHRLRHVLLLGLAGVFSVSAAARGDEAATWTPERMLAVRRIAEVRPSPDGQRVAYTVARAMMIEDHSEFVPQIWISNADGTGAVQMTFGSKPSNNPTWSPDGKTLAFTSGRAGKSNLYALRVAGGEAQQLTELPSHAGAPCWSPDGSQIAFLMTDPDSAEEARKKRSKDDARWLGRDPRMDRLYVLPVAEACRAASEGGTLPKPRLLTAGEFTLSSPARPGGSTFDWSPDGRSIVFSHRQHPLADHWPTAALSVVDVASGEIRPLIASGRAEFSPRYSPDGKWIAYVASDDPPRWAGSFSMAIVPANGGDAKLLPDTHDQQPLLLGWSADGERLYFAEAHGTLNRLCAMAVPSGQVDELYAGGELLRSWELNSTATALGFVIESPRQAPEAGVSMLKQFSPRRISQANADVQELPLGKVELVQWSSFDGQKIEGLLTLPVGFQVGQRVPLLLHIHGGPMGLFQQTFPGSAGSYPTAAFSSHGFAILQPNPRGSSGYGREFRFANYQDWGGGDFKDLMAGVDHLVEQGIADPDRLGVMGWSYGGYMTSWTITQTRRFKAASIGAAVTNLVSFTGTADIPGFLPDYLGAQPWEELALYRGRSPVLRAKGVTTPALLQHGEADVRVPISQGYEFYNSLKQQGTPAEMLVLPRQPHGPTEPRMILTLMRTNLNWFQKHLTGSSATPDFSSLERVAEAELKLTHTPGAAIAIVRGDRILYERGFGLANVETGQPVTPEMLFRLGSTTKMFTAAALVSLAEQGQLKLDHPVGEYIPELHSSIAALTPHQLLTHSAGLTDESVMSGLHDESALAAGVRGMDDTWLFTQPGTLHSYANPGYWIAGLACQQLAGKPYAEVLHERLFQPLGMKRTTLKPTLAMTWPLALGHEVRGGAAAMVRPQADNAGTWPAGQMYSNVGELARFAIAFLNEGQLEGQQVLSKSLISTLSAPYVERPGTKDHYGYGLVIGEHRGVRIVSHGGSRAGYGSTIRLAPEHKVAVIVLANRSASSLPKTAEKALEIMLPLAPETPASRQPRPLTPTERDHLTGSYTNNRQTLELFVRDKRLMLRRSSTDGPAKPAIPVLKLDDDRLIARPAAGGGDSATTTLVIVRDASGRPSHLCTGSRAMKRQD